MPKPSLPEEQSWCYLTHSWEDKRVYTIHKGICLKVNVIELLEFELVYYNSTVQRFNHYTHTTRTLLLVLELNLTEMLDLYCSEESKDFCEESFFVET